MTEKEPLIVGVGLSKISRSYEKGLTDLFFEVTSEATKNNVVDNIDALIVSNVFSPLLQSQNILATLLSEELGLRGIQVFTIENGGASGNTAIHLANSMIRSGFAENILVVGVEKLTDYNSNVYNSALTQLTNAEFEGLYGANIISNFALIANEYLKKYNIGEELLAEWPVFMHENSLNAEHSMLRFKVKLERVLSSDIVSYPLRVLHSPPFADGAAAVLITSDESVREEAYAAIEATTVVNDLVEVSLRNDLTYFYSAKLALEKLLSMSKIQLNEIGIIDVMDKYSIAGPVVLESMGLVDKGRTLYYVRDGRFRLGDKPVINLTGGTKARGHPVGATGVYQIAEIVSSFHSINGVKHVPEAEYGLAIGIGGIGAVASGIILRRV